LGHRTSIPSTLIPPASRRYTHVTLTCVLESKRSILFKECNYHDVRHLGVQAKAFSCRNRGVFANDLALEVVDKEVNSTVRIKMASEGAATAVLEELSVLSAIDSRNDGATIEFLGSI
jgi:hypothetical protein